MNARHALIVSIFLVAQLALVSRVAAAPSASQRATAASTHGCQVAFIALSAKVALGYASVVRSTGTTTSPQAIKMRQTLRTLVEGALLTEAAVTASGVPVASIASEAQALSQRVLANLEGDDAKNCQTTFTVLAVTARQSLEAAKVSQFESLVDAMTDRAIELSTSAR
jgi:hypothetical protein